MKTLAENYYGKSVIVTGAAGFIGLNLASHLLEAGAKVVAWIRPGNSSARVDALRKTNAVIEAVDLMDHDAVKKSIAANQPKVVFHMASIGTDGRDRPINDFIQQNILPSVLLMEESRQHAFRLVAAGTMFELESLSFPQDESASPMPINAYAWSKTATLNFFQLPANAKSDWIWLRLFGVFGPWESSARVFPHVLRGLLRNEAIALSSCSSIRDFIYIQDVVEAILDAGTAACSREVFHIGTGQAHRLRDLLERIAKDFGKAHLLKFGALPDRTTEIKSLWANTDKARQLLGWKARQTAIDGVNLFRNWGLTQTGRDFLQI